MKDLLIAQALVEHGLLSSIAAGIASVRYQIELHLGPDVPRYLAIAGAIFAVYLFFCRRRAR